MNRVKLTLAIVVFATLATSARSAKAERPSMTDYVDQILYNSIDRAMAHSSQSLSGVETMQFVAAGSKGDVFSKNAGELEFSSTFERSVRALEPGDFRRLMETIHSLPFKSRQEQINDLLATLHTLQV